MTHLPHRALVDRVRLLSPAARRGLWEALAAKPGALSDVRHEWEGFWARPDQVIAPEELDQYGLIVITGGRGEGKTRTAVQLFVREVDEGRAVAPRIFAATEADVDKAVVHGESGIFAALDEEQQKRWRWLADEGPAGTLRVTNKLGAEIHVTCFTAKAADGAVGFNSDLDLYDDVAKWGPSALTAWSHARLSCRVGYACGIVATTQRGTALLRKLLKGNMDGVLLRRLGLGTNAGNIAAKWRGQMVAELGEINADLLRQELDDEDISASSPFGGIDFDKPPVRVHEVRRDEVAEVVIAVDPSDGKGGQHDEWGIGAACRRHDRHVVALEDGSGSYDDAEGAAKALELCARWRATKIIVEQNRGPRVLNAIRAAWYQRASEAHARGEHVAGAIPEVIGVTARDGKALRAGPVRPLYLAGQLHHVAGLGVLERQMREWDPDGPKRPRQDDRIDWLVHAVHHLAGLGREFDNWAAKAPPPATAPADPWRYQAPVADAGPDPYRYT